MPAIISIPPSILRVSLGLGIFKVERETSHLSFSFLNAKIPKFINIKPATTRSIKGARSEYVSRSGNGFNIRVV